MYSRCRVEFVESRFVYASLATWPNLVTTLRYCFSVDANISVRFAEPSGKQRRNSVDDSGGKMIEPSPKTMYASSRVLWNAKQRENVSLLSCFRGREDRERTSKEYNNAAWVCSSTVNASSTFELFRDVQLGETFEIIVRTRRDKLLAFVFRRFLHGRDVLILVGNGHECVSHRCLTASSRSHDRRPQSLVDVALLFASRVRLCTFVLFH